MISLSCASLVESTFFNFCIDFSPCSNISFLASLCSGTRSWNSPADSVVQPMIHVLNGGLDSLGILRRRQEHPVSNMPNVVTCTYCIHTGYLHTHNIQVQSCHLELQYIFFLNCVATARSDQLFRVVPMLKHQCTAMDVIS